MVEGQLDGSGAGLRPTLSADPQEQLRRSGVSSVCQGCGECFSGGYWVRGNCPHCNAVLCFKCWKTGRHLCAALATSEPTRGVDTTGMRSPEARSVNTCSRCQKSLPLAMTRPGLERYYCIACQRELASPPANLMPGAITFDEAVYRQLLFKRFVEEALAHTIGQSTADLRVTKVRREKSVTDPATEPDFSTHPFRDVFGERINLLPPERYVQMSVTFKRGRGLFTRGKQTLHLDLDANASARSMVEDGFAAPADEKVIAGMMRSRSANCPTDEVRVLFAPAGWKEGLRLPKNTVTVWLGAHGDWQYRHTIADAIATAYISSLFDIGSHEDKVDECVREVFKQPGANFPLSARRLAESRGWPTHLVAEAFRRLAERENGLMVCDDPQKNDWLLDIR